MFVLYITGISAQSTMVNDDLPRVIEINSYLNANVTVSKNNSARFSDAKNLDKLIFEVQPSIYYYAATVKNYGDKPKNFFTDLSSLDQLNSLNVSKNNIEIIVFSINNTGDLSANIDLAKLSSFKNLKYIYFISKVTVTEQTLANLITNYSAKYSLYYKLISATSEQ